MDPNLPGQLVSPLDQASAQEAWSKCRAALALLPIDQRECLIARFDYDYSYDEIAALLGKPSPDAARMSVKRALTQLGGLLES